MDDERKDRTLDENLARLLRDGVEHPRPSPERRAAMLDALKATQAKLHRPEESAMDQATPSRRWLPWMLAAAAVLLIVAGWVALTPKAPDPIAHGPETPFRVVAPSGVGEPRKRTLSDGTVVIARAGAEYRVTGERKLALATGDVYLIVAEAKRPFVVETKHGTATAKGTRLAITTGEDTRVYVAQGIVDIENEEGELEVKSGQEGVLPPDPNDEPRRGPAPRISFLVSWAREALAQDERLVAKKTHDTGELVAVDPSGQEMRLSLRDYHVDVHIEDGVARTTVDQTFFNHVPWNIEGTFTFPLPPGASVSRLAMYVSGKLMEGGMVERSRGQAIYTEIKLQRRDPALLEMMEGNVFKMRIFPIEGRQEKRIFLSYTQKLDELYGTLRYWFPMDHTHSNARKLSLRVRAKDALGRYTAHSSTHKLDVAEEGRDLVLTHRAEDVKPDEDLLVHLVPTAKAGRASVTTFSKDGHRYVFARLTPKLPGEIAPQPRSWIVLNDVSASRTKLDIRAQAHILERLLVEADDFDTVALVNLNVKAKVVGQPFVLVRDPKAEGLVKQAVVDLPIGGTNLSSGLEAARWLIEQHKAPNPHILYLGDGVATDGKTTIDSLLRHVPKGATFVGVGVGKKADANALQSLADDTGGLFALINPDEDIDWRVFDLVSALNTPRLLGLTAEFQTGGGKAADIIAYPSARALADGETLFVVGRTEGELPKSLVLKGTAGGEAYERRYAMADAGDDGSYIPRLWAKRHIDELLKSGDEHKDEIVRLSKQYYVMTPYASLIVLENEAMYKQYKVERGRKDHWALYPAPKEIPVVKEPLERQYWSWWGWVPEDEKIKAKGEPQTVKDIVESVQFRINAPFYFWPPQQEGYGRFALYSLLGSKGDATGLMTVLLHAGARQGDEAAGQGAEPGTRGKPLGETAGTLAVSSATPTLSLVSGTVIRGEFLPPVMGERLDIRARFAYYDSYIAPQFSLGDVSVLSFGGEVGEGLELAGQIPVMGKLTTGWADGLALSLLTDDSRSMRGTTTFEIIAPQGLISTESLLAEAWDYEVPLAGFVVNEQLAEVNKLQNALGTRLYDLNGAGLTKYELAIPAQVGRGLGRALTERFGRISSDIRRHNAMHGHWGAWGRHSWQRSGLDLSRTYSATVYRSLRGIVKGTELNGPSLDLYLSDGDDLARPVVVLGGEALPPTSYALASYGRAIKTVPGTAAAITADTVLPRRDELVAKTRTEREERLLTLIQAALGDIETAYPRFEDAGLFWGRQGSSYRPQPWTFQPPQVQAYAHYNWSFDLTRYATGLYSTSADVVNAVAERFGTGPAGAAHIMAAKLVGSARRRIRPVRVQYHKDGPAVLVGPDDRLDFTRTTSMYLKERIVCDGAQILHLYDELGLAARRKATPLRRAALRRLTPHLIEPVAWLRRKYDVELAGEQADRFTLKLIPFALDANGKKKSFDLHLLVTVLADGRIADKTLVVEGKARLKLAFAYDDATVTLRWLDPDGKELRKADFRAEPFTPDADTFKADLAPLAVFDMPLRKPSYYQAKLTAAGDDKAEGVRLRRHLALAHIQELHWRRWGGQNSNVLKVMQQVTDALGHEDGKLRLKLGDITLLGAAGQRYTAETWAKKTGFTTDSPVVAYFATHRRNNAKLPAVRDANPGTLVGHLAAYHSAIQRRDPPAHLDAFLSNYDRSPLLFAAVFYHSGGGSKPEGFAKLFDHPRWGPLAILTAAQHAKKDEQKQAVAAAFAKLHAVRTKEGLEVPVTPHMAALLRQADGGKHWQAVIRAALKVATDSERPAPLLRFAELALLNGERQLAEVAIAQATKLATHPDSLLAKLTLAQTWWAGGQPKEALKLYDELFAGLEARKLPPSSVMLAAGARLAQQAGDLGRATDLEERALAIEHRHLPELINLQAFHQRYRWLWNQYVTKVAMAAQVGDDAAVTDWVARAEETWARWYEVDPSITTVHLMADLQSAARNKDGVWLYLSSIIDAKPKEAWNHFEVGQWYEREGRDLDAAQHWYANAAQWDTANPRYLYERARVLRSLKRTDESKKLLRQIADGKWAQGHRGWVDRARRELDR